MIKINKSLLLAGMLSFAPFVSFASTTAYLINFDLTLLRPYVKEARQVLNDASYSYFYGVRAAQKRGLRAIKHRLKYSARYGRRCGEWNWYSQRQLYKAFKVYVYKYWKRTGQLPVV